MAPFWLLVVINAFVGAMVGLERTTLPILAREEFAIVSLAATTSFVATFGISKAFVNLVAGRAADAWGRKRVLLIGWALGVPAALGVALATEWWHVLAANVLLGANQGLAWSMTLNLKLDVVGEKRRGFAAGWNELAGYGGVALAAFGASELTLRTGWTRGPFYLGVAIALVGFALSLFAPDPRAPATPRGALRRAFRAASGGERGLTGASVAGLATNLKDGALWGLLPLLLVLRGVAVEHAAVIIAAYPLSWGLSQAAFGALSDRGHRRALAASGLVLQGVGVAGLAFLDAWPALTAAALVTGLGTGLAYPTLLAHVADLAPAEARATSLGVYRFWRDLGYAFGALGGGLAADLLGIGAALGIAAAVVGFAALGLASRP